MANGVGVEDVAVDDAAWFCHGGNYLFVWCWVRLVMKVVPKFGARTSITLQAWEVFFERERSGNRWTDDDDGPGDRSMVDEVASIFLKKDFLPRNWYNEDSISLYVTKICI